MEHIPLPVRIFSIWLNYQWHSCSMQCLLQGLVKTEFGSLIFVEWAMLSFPWYVSITPASSQYDWGMLSSQIKTRSFCFRLCWTLFYFLCICNIGRYSCMKRAQNIFASACTAFLWVLPVTWLSLIVSGLKKDCFRNLYCCLYSCTVLVDLIVLWVVKIKFNLSLNFWQLLNVLLW